jgi:hypothetical protein
MASVYIRFRIASSRLIVAAAASFSIRCFVYARTSAVVMVLMRRPPKYGVRWRLSRALTSRRERRPLI